jgi:tetratricopeptide (TPR) repeat protein
MPAVGENIEAVKTYARGDYASAAKMLEPSYRAGKAGIQDRLILARAYLHLNRPEESLAVLKNVLDSDKENPEANGLTGQLLLKAGKNEDALKYLEHAYRLKPDAEAASALGRCYYALGDIPKAKSSLAAALQQDIRDPSNSFLLGRIHLDRGSGALAEKYLLMAQEAKMDSPELHLLLGKAYLLQRKTVGPVLVKRLPGSVKVGDIVDGFVVLGKAPAAPNQYKVCTRYCSLYEGLLLLRINNQDPDGLYMAASGWFEAGNCELAARYLKELTEKEPKSARAWQLQAGLLVAMKDFDSLRKVLAEGKSAGRFDSRSVAGFLCRAAAVLRSQGNCPQAIAMLKQAEGEQPIAEEVLRPLAALYVAVGDDRQAATYYGRIVELFPDAADIDELNNTLKVLREKTGVQK